MSKARQLTDYQKEQLKRLVLDSIMIVVRYHNIYIYTLLHKWGFKQKVPRKVHVNTASREEKEGLLSLVLHKTLKKKGKR
jgi:hypothetical protein